LALALKTDQKAPSFTRVVTDLRALNNRDLEQVDSEILARLASPVTMIPDLAGHLIHAGGKRLRPLLTLSSASAVQYQGQNHIPLAAAVELIHGATLLHDDVVDDSALRRGAKTANIIWGNKESVLVGDYIFSRAFELMVEANNLRVLKILSHASSVIAEGEVLQLATQKNLDTTKAMYIDVINVGDDFREGKMTLPVILAIAQANSDEKRFWKRTITDGSQHGDDFGQACALIEKHGGIQETFSLAQEYSSTAIRNLEALPDNEHTQILADLVETSLTRSH